jgi:hypothetical protein
MAVKKNIASIEGIFLKLADDTKASVRSALAENPKIDGEIQSALLLSPTAGVVRGLAMNSSATKETIDKLLQIAKTDEELKSFVIQGFFDCAKLPKDVVKLITSNDYASFDFMAIKSSALSSADKQIFLKRMIKKDAYETVLQDAALCDALDKDQIDFFLQHEAEGVRANLAKNPIISGEVQSKLAKDQSTLVRRLLAANPSISEKVAQTLSKDSESAVVFNLEQNLRARSQKSPAVKTKADYDQLIKSTNDKDLIALGLDVQTPLNIIEQLCEKSQPGYDSWLSVAIAGNTNTPNMKLADIAKSKNVEVLKGLAANPSVTLDILAVLAKNKDPQVRAIVANPNWYKLPPFMMQ